MLHQEITSSQARNNFYRILERVGEGGNTYTVRIYKDAKVRIIREEFAQILEQIIGKNTWNEIHLVLDREKRVGEETKETIKKILKPKLRS